MPLASVLPLRLRSKVPSWVIGVLSLLPLSVRLAKDRVPAVGAVLSTITSMALLVELLPAGSVTTARN